jgi:hypothetical protein
MMDDAAFIDEFVATTFLVHAVAPYDPVYAHQYYLRTRQLKGRQSGAAQPAIGEVRPKGVVTSNLKPAAKPPAPKPKAKPKTLPKSAAELLKEANQHVAVLRGKLHTLQMLLHKLEVKAAASKHSTKKRAPETAAQKQKAKEKRLQNKASGKTSSHHNPTVKQQITTVKGQIASIQKQLTTAIAHAHAEAVAAMKKLP